MLRATQKITVANAAMRQQTRRFADSAKAVVEPSETLKQKAMRWLDIFGTHTRYWNRRAWVMDLHPNDRVWAHMWTEYDRKVGFFMFGMWTFNMSVAWLYLQNNVQENHRVMSAPFPLPYAYGAEMEPRDNWISAADDVFYSQCKDCRNMDWQCKRICFDRLRDMGYPIWGFQRSIVEVGSHRFLPENKITWEPQIAWAKMFGSNNGSQSSH
ncbi:unnamed protein product [Amoebophrya sp. A120]|nr:unnamed protein product [Amoebophrya sp. A120]|eukprot:GSA120T00018771001.1